MANYDVYDLKAAKVGEVELADEVFACEVNTQAIFDAVLRQQSSWRQGTHKVKNRREVSGGGKKPFRQKGTGRARQGSIRAPQWTGGGVALGPKPRSYRFSINKKVKRIALKSALSAKYADYKVFVIDELKLDEIKTAKIANLLKGLGVNTKALIVTDLADENIYKSARNIKGVSVTPSAKMEKNEETDKLVHKAGAINVYDILSHDALILSKEAIAKLEEVLA